jgi:mono/diheme cytochrome c family protein
MMKNFSKIVVALLVVASITSCDKRTRQSQYMPDMYESVPYDADGDKGLTTNNNRADLKPAARSIARGNVPYEYPNTNDGYEAAKSTLKSPLELTEKNKDNGKKMYNIYCISCHGAKGDGNGVLSQRDKFNGIPNYKDRDITEGSIYHVIMYGKGLMGSHSSQLTRKERWQIISYVEKLRSDLLK